MRTQEAALILSFTVAQPKMPQAFGHPTLSFINNNGQTRPHLAAIASERVGGTLDMFQNTFTYRRHNLTWLLPILAVIAAGLSPALSSSAQSEEAFERKADAELRRFYQSGGANEPR